MPVFPEIIKSIASQHEQHKDLNLFYGGKSAALAWTPYTRFLLATYPREILQLNADGLTAGLVNYLTTQAQLTFCATNQYMNVSGAAGESLKAVYSALMEDIVTQLQNKQTNFDGLEQLHGQRLTQWLLRTNAFVREINGTLEPQVKRVVCAEYSPATQLSVLHLDVLSMKGPVLDIGCGQQALLVRYLRQQGIEAYGIDRFIEQPAPYLQSVDWLEYATIPNRWGTIISNLSFSNHFLHHHQRSDSAYMGYARKFMEILRSLQTGGSYHYAPALPMMEAYLPSAQYAITHHKVGDHFRNTVITRKE
ncbi:methyltransferase domain-containing protein [Chitinophaga arvensicola]|uniref:Methyltransferase domain-containing protein n=1 Tax=Chitinophaga arvensicola TaxID=29529 RepID=A0A1I0R6W0_9BACT|nr:hypothetical protein [Chitinophaga arvensicola]SEW36380.1 hypothetical protein SAMN04488122_2382 [Chitinophaga arvensicola]